MGEAVQALCFLAGANSIFAGDKLLVTGNPDVEAPMCNSLQPKLGLNGHPHNRHRCAGHPVRRAGADGLYPLWIPMDGSTGMSGAGQCRSQGFGDAATLRWPNG